MWRGPAAAVLGPLSGCGGGRESAAGPAGPRGGALANGIGAVPGSSCGGGENENSRGPLSRLAPAACCSGCSCCRPLAVAGGMSASWEKAPPLSGLSVGALLPPEREGDP